MVLPGGAFGIGPSGAVEVCQDISGKDLKRMKNGVTIRTAQHRLTALFFAAIKPHMAFGTDDRRI